MNQDFGRWLRAANPLNAPRGMAEAQRGARLAAVALLLQTVGGLPLSLHIIVNPQSVIRLMMEEFERSGVPSDTSYVEAIGPIISGAYLVALVVMTVIYLILARVQWRNMKRTIPLVMLAFAGWSYFSVLLQLATRGRLPYVDAPVLYGWSWLVMTLCTVLYVAAFRNATALEKMKRAP